MELFWEDVPQLIGRRIETVRFTSLGTIVGKSLVVVACTDGTLVRLECDDLGCQVAEVSIGSGEDGEDGEESGRD